MHESFDSIWQKSLRWLVLAILFFGALGALHVIFGKIDPGKKAELYIEFTKSLLQLLVVILIGGLVAWIFRYLQNSSKNDKALRDFRIEFLNRLHACDESITKSRRAFRMQGFTRKYPYQVVTPAQMSSYDEQIAVLSETEVAVSRLLRDLEQSRDAFTKYGPLASKLRIMRDFLKTLFEEYEKSRQKFPNLHSNDYPILVGYTDLPQGREFGHWVSGYEESVALIRSDLLPVKISIQS